MRKNDLIKLLESFEGNPEVMLWNGFVEDYMPIQDLKQTKLFKKSEEQHLASLTYEYRYNKESLGPIPKEDMDTLRERAKKQAANNPYERPNSYLDPQHYSLWYDQTKKIIGIHPKTTGKKVTDRIGSMEY